MKEEEEVLTRLASKDEVDFDVERMQQLPVGWIAQRNRRIAQRNDMLVPLPP